jgi:hypothetical protein
MSLFYPDIPKPISVVTAEHGSAKTTERCSSEAQHILNKLLTF